MSQSKSKPINELEHPSEDRSNRFPKDRLLRLHGYRIHSRPNKGEAIWKREEILFPYSEAVSKMETLIRQKHQG